MGDIIKYKRLATLFQPLVNVSERQIIGFEALTRGPSNGRLHAPQHLFQAARGGQYRVDLEFLCVELAASRFVQAGLTGRLFVNVSPDCFYEEPKFTERFVRTVTKAGLGPEHCVIELTEDRLLDDYATLRSTLQHLRELGCECAIDDLGAGSSGLRVWSELRPEYVKIDRYFISGVDADSTKLSFVRSIVDIGRTIGCRVIAEGVETEAEGRELVALGVERLQGYLFGRPEETPSVSSEQFDWFETAPGIQGARCAGDLAVAVPAIAPQTTVMQVADLFRQRTTRNMFVVAREGVPLGIVHREHLFALLSRPYHPEVYNRKPISEVMDTKPLAIDANLRLEMASRLITHVAGHRLADEFLIVAHGKYLGIARTMDLLRQITEQQIDAAKHSNPLTLLPGNGPLRDCIRRLQLDERAFFICYVDLDFFKPYNDVYGYAQGDQVLLHLSELLKAAISTRIDFLGHVGGDDFVLVMRSPDWRERLATMQAAFASSIRRFYSGEHMAAGCVICGDREGFSQRYPLLSVSIAALDSATEGCTSPEAAAQLLVEAKKRAKMKQGNSFVVRSNLGICDLDEPRTTPGV